MLCKLESLLAGPAHFVPDSLFVLSAHGDGVVHGPNMGPNKRKYQHDSNEWNDGDEECAFNPAHNLNIAGTWLLLTSELTHLIIL